MAPDMFLCALEIGHSSVLKNIGGAIAPPAPQSDRSPSSPASWGLPLRTIKDSINAAYQRGVNIDTIKIGDPYWIIQDNRIYYATASNAIG